MIRIDKPKSLSIAKPVTARLPDGPDTEQRELEWMPATVVPMSDEEWDEAVELLAEIFAPALDRLAERLRPCSGQAA